MLLCDIQLEMNREIGRGKGIWAGKPLTKEGGVL